MMGLGFFVSSKDLVFPVNSAQEQETSMWSLLCLRANKSSDFIFKPLNGDWGCILRLWISQPGPLSEEHRKQNLINPSAPSPRQGRCVKGLWARAPPAPSAHEGPLGLVHADSDPAGVPGGAPRDAAFLSSAQGSDATSHEPLLRQQECRGFLPWKSYPVCVWQSLEGLPGIPSRYSCPYKPSP